MTRDSFQDIRDSDMFVNGWHRCEKTLTFDGATTNGIGDFDGTGNPATLFTVTGIIRVRIFAKCTTSLTITAGSTQSVGTALTTAGLIALTAGDAPDVNEIWHDATPDASIELDTVSTEKIISQNIISTTATANTLTGVIKFVLFWRAISDDGNAVSA